MNSDAIATLALCCRRVEGDDVCVGLAPLNSDETLREAVLALAAHHAVTGLVLATLERTGVLASLPRERGAQLLDLLKRYRRRALVLEAERDRVVTTLRRRGMDPVVLKGGALASSRFREPVERFYGDIDLLLRGDQIEDAARSLRALGYTSSLSEAVKEGFRSHHFHLRVEHERGAIVELHWGLARPHVPFWLDPETFLTESVAEGNGSGIVLRMPRPEHMLLHIALQNVQEGFRRFTRLVDIDRIVAAAPEMDWRYAVETARAGHLASALALSLRLTQRFLGTQIPREAIERACSSGSTRMHLALLRPARTITQAGGARTRAAEELLGLWLLPARERRLALRRLLSLSSEDPLRWIWDKEESAEDARRSLGWSLLSASKVIAYQLGAYAEAIGSTVRSRGWGELRLW